MALRISNLISLVFHPVFMPFFTYLFLFKKGNEELFLVSASIEKLVLIIVFINTALLPLLFSLSLKKMGIIQSLRMRDATERKYPYWFSLLAFAVTYYILLRAKLPVEFQRTACGGILALFLVTIITYRWKISAHMTGMGGLCALVYGVQFGLPQSDVFMFPLFILLAGVVATARLILQEHNLWQLLAGFYNGFIPVLLCWFFG